jgi:Uma2 family endonuclease
VDGAPVLAVEILSPSDTQENISEKAQACLDAGVRVVWVINPYFDLVTVLQPGHESVSYGRDEILEGGAHLPGFSAPVSKLLGLP